MVRVSLQPLNLPESEQVTLADVIDAAIDHADRQREALAEHGDLESLAWGLTAIREMQRKLSMLERQTDGDVARLVRDHADRSPFIDGLGTLEVHRRSTKVRWESERLFGLLIDAIADEAIVDTETGEMVGDPTTARAITALLRERLAACLPLTASMGWRVGGLKAAGVDPETYREREIGPDTVRIVGGESAGGF